MDHRALVNEAQKCKEHAYSPYSKFKVGAVVVMEDDTVYTGANVENASYGATICAERTAIVKAVSEGKRKIKSIAIASDLEDFIYPCGMCRQVIAEFSSKDTKIVCSNAKGECKSYTIEEIFPNIFYFET